MIRPLRRGAAIGLCVSLMFLAQSPIVFAADTTSPSPQPSAPSASTSYNIADSDFALAISPARLAIGQGDLGNIQKFLVINRGRAPAVVEVQKRNFTASITGSVVYQDEAAYSASKWITADPTNFEIASGASQVVTVAIEPPANPEAGDHQVALVFFSPSADTGEGNVKINRGIGAPIYITAPGPIDDSATLSNLSAPGFAMGGPVEVTATVTNIGTVHRDFRDDAPLTIDVSGTPAPFPDFTVPRATVRDVSTTWDPPLLCICNPTVQFTNADGSVQSASVQVIVFPLKLLGIVVGAILILLLVLWFSRSRYRASVTKAAALHRPVGRGDA